MKRFLLSLTILAAGAVSALAADLPAAVYTKAPVVKPILAYDWNGFYIGGNAGGAWGSFDPRTTTVDNGTYFVPSDIALVAGAGAQSIKPNGFTGGLEAGYNWQAGKIVFGLEGDIQSFRLKGSVTSGPVNYISIPIDSFVVNASASTSWLATTRGRIGVTADNWLFFATGGAAFTNLGGSFSFTDNFGPASETASFSNTRAGYVAGGGIEAGLWGRWSVKAEYLYVNFGTVSTTGLLVNDPRQPLFHSADLTASIARIGVNYRFGGPDAAKY